MAKTFEYPENPASTIKEQFEQIWRRSIRETETFNENVNEFLNRIKKLENGSNAAGQDISNLQEKAREINASCLKLSHDKLSSVSLEMDDSTPNFDDMITPGNYYLEITSSILNYPRTLSVGDKVLVNVIGEPSFIICQIVIPTTGTIIVRFKVGGYFGYWYTFTGDPIY